MLVNGEINRNMAKEGSTGQMEHIMRVIGKTTVLMEKVDSFILMVLITYDL